MKNLYLIAFATASALICLSCEHPKKKIITPVKEIEQKKGVVSISDMLTIASGDSIMISRQHLTSCDGFDHAFGYDKDFEGYYEEATKPEETFYFPAPELRAKNPSLVAAVQQSWNYASVYNRVIHAYELFKRASTDFDSEEEKEQFDTLAFLKKYALRFSDQFLTRAFPNADTRKEIKKLLAAFMDFDGNDSENAPITKALKHYSDYYNTLPRAAGKEVIDHFEKDFWPWYDKAQFIPEVDSLITMHLKGTKRRSLSDEEYDYFNKIVASNTDIDKRAILALELARFDCCDGALFLGDIIESRQYTRYLLECWISWRASAQATHSPSSMTIIPNNYFDKVRVICIDTMLRHAIEHNDTNALCLLQNLIVCQVLHRQAAISGNESMVIRMNLDYNWFIHPRLLKAMQE
ncbi:MAG: hypothetical protein IJ222_06765 [Bacteroidales bacterium]|nr:hypothetical protein [Bacteroidales bacterium]